MAVRIRPFCHCGLDPQSEELAAVLALMPDEHKQIAAGREFWAGHLHGQDARAQRKSGHTGRLCGSRVKPGMTCAYSLMSTP